MLEGDGYDEMKYSSVQIERCKESIKLIWNISGEEWKHSAHIAHTRNLNFYRVKSDLRIELEGINLNLTCEHNEASS